ncbi:cupin domain-containing protein [Spirosoma rhododendri]|uniref:cupin domain-containing protein n=1 Tax=Spirosoma rhododendri TaxID=2728024 RepID=UPI0020C2E3B1|nr:cupin domain-containing protein [Spirosoma rhododendri]
MLVPPGGGPGPHAHANIIETFYVIDGEVVIRSETQTYTARKGASVTIPMGGAVHMFKNESDKPAHLLCIVVPSGLEAMFQEIGQPVAADEFLPPPAVTPDWIAQMQAVAEKHGQEVFPPDYFETK